MEKKRQKKYYINKFLVKYKIDINIKISDIFIYYVKN